MSIFSGVCACHKSNVSDITYNGRCMKFGAMGRSLLSEMGSLCKIMTVWRTS